MEGKQMMIVDLDRAIKRKSSDFMLRGKGLDNLRYINNKRMNNRIDWLRSGGIMSFPKINELIHAVLDDIEYIDFWKTVDIICVENY
jgi:hypothetical protein